MEVEASISTLVLIVVGVFDMVKLAVGKIATIGETFKWIFIAPQQAVYEHQEPLVLNLINAVLVVTPDVEEVYKATVSPVAFVVSKPTKYWPDTAIGASKITLVSFLFATSNLISEILTDLVLRIVPGLPLLFW